MGDDDAHVTVEEVHVEDPQAGGWVILWIGLLMWRRVISMLL